MIVEVEMGRWRKDAQKRVALPRLWRRIWRRGFETQVLGMWGRTSAHVKGASRKGGIAGRRIASVEVESEGVTGLG